MDMEIKQGNNQFYIGEEAHPLAEITYYVKSDRVIAADHTYVSEELRGQGIANKLLERLAAFAREKKLLIEPICSFVKREFDRSDAYADLDASKQK